MSDTKPVDFLGKYSAGQKQISASDLNTLIHFAKLFRRMSVAPPLQLHWGNNCVTLSLMEEPVEAEAVEKYGVITTTLDIAAPSFYVLTVEDEPLPITINRVLEEDDEKDMRAYHPWFNVGQRVPVVLIGDYWRIKSTLIYVGLESRSISWNTEDWRQMAVWA